MPQCPDILEKIEPASCAFCLNAYFGAPYGECSVECTTKQVKPWEHCELFARRMPRCDGGYTHTVNKNYNNVSSVGFNSIYPFDRLFAGYIET